MRYLVIISIFLYLLTSCAKDENEGNEDPDLPLTFSSLKVENDTIKPGETTKIIADASGYKLSYYWSASAGDILGKGKEVVYAVSICHIGKNKITCTINDGNNVSKSKELFIVVK
jgi:hypothetical protein